MLAVIIWSKIKQEIQDQTMGVMMFFPIFIIFNKLRYIHLYSTNTFISLSQTEFNILILFKYNSDGAGPSLFRLQQALLLLMLASATMNDKSIELILIPFTLFYKGTTKERTEGKEKSCVLYYILSHQQILVHSLTTWQYIYKDIKYNTSFKI